MRVSRSLSLSLLGGCGCGCGCDEGGGGGVGRILLPSIILRICVSPVLCCWLLASAVKMRGTQVRAAKQGEVGKEGRK